jgi:hypothetical protein
MTRKKARKIVRKLFGSDARILDVRDTQPDLKANHPVWVGVWKKPDFVIFGRGTNRRTAINNAKASIMGHTLRGIPLPSSRKRLRLEDAQTGEEGGSDRREGRSRTSDAPSRKRLKLEEPAPAGRKRLRLPDEDE